MISETMRQKMLIHTKEQIPHSVKVILETMDQSNDRMHVQATIITERDSQKGILIGKKGQMLKKIGQESRLELEEILEKKIFLELWVKVQKDWRNKQTLLTQYGFDSN